jgi:hypothetical protein
MDKAFLAGKHGYDCDTAGGEITVWRDARPQPDWSALWVEEVAFREQIASYVDALDSGYIDSETGITLKTTAHAQAMFTSMVTMLQEGLCLGVITNSTEQVIWNFDNEPVTLTVLEIRQLLFRYGMHCKNFFDLYAP